MHVLIYINSSNNYKECLGALSEAGIDYSAITYDQTFENSIKVYNNYECDADVFLLTTGSNDTTAKFIQLLEQRRTVLHDKTIILFCDDDEGYYHRMAEQWRLDHLIKSDSIQQWYTCVHDVETLIQVLQKQQAQD